jgi:tetratricopeptide (TPR) repeat protein
MKIKRILQLLMALPVGFALLASLRPAAAQEGKIALTTGSPQALAAFLEGRDLQEKLRAQDSLRFFEEAVKQDPEFAMGYLFLAGAQPSAKGFFENLEKAVALSDKATEGERLWILGAEAGANGLPAKQREYYEKLVASYPNDERAHNLLGNHYFGQQDWPAAIREFEKAISINPEFSQPYNQLGYAQRFLENYAEAEKSFRKYIELIPGDPNPQDSYAELLMKMGKYDASIEAYRKALAIDPHFVASHTGIATNLIFKKDYAGARKGLEEFLAIARNDGERRAAHFIAALSYVHEGNPDQALNEIGKEYELAAKISDAAAMSGDLVTMGTILLEDGKTDEALAKFEESVRVVEASDLSDEFKENTRRIHLYNAGYAAVKKNDLTEAAQKSEELRTQAEAVHNAFQIRLAHELAGMIALEEKDWEKAREELAQANQQDPYNIYRMALALEGRGDKEAAKQLYTKAADFNALNSLTYALVSEKARQEGDSL